MAASAKVDAPVAETRVDVVGVDAQAAEDKADATNHVLNPKR